MPQPTAIQPSQAVERCWAAYQQAYREAIAAGQSSFQAKKPAREAYLNAMPRLDTREDIRCFIACVTHGMLFDVFWRDNGSKLLAAARIATAVLPREFRPVGRPKSQPDPLTEEITPPVLEK